MSQRAEFGPGLVDGREHYDTFHDPSLAETDSAGAPLLKPRVILPDMSGKFTTFQLAMLSISVAGVQVVWSVQNGTATKVFREAGMPSELVSLAFLAGPISGIVMQPIVGAWSDRCTSSMGRRRPYLIAGAVAVCLSAIVFALGTSIGVSFGDPRECDSYKVSVNEGDCPASVGILVLSFWVLDFSLNAIQGPARTLLADVVPPDQHDEGNAWFAFMVSVGNMTGYSLAAIRIASYIPGVENDARVLFFFCAIVIICCIFLTVRYTHEDPLERNEQGDISAAGVFLRLGSVFREVPSIVRRCAIVQMSVWFSFFTIIIYFATFVGEDVFGGKPAGGLNEEKDIYKEGVRFANLGFAVQAIVCFILTFSLSGFRAILVRAMDKIGTGRVYAASIYLQGAALLLAPFVAHESYPPSNRDKILTVVMIGSIGFTWATALTIPWSLVTQAVAKTNTAGLSLATFNLSHCAPEILASLIGSASVAATHGYVAPLVIAGLVSLAGGPLVAKYRVGYDDE